MIAVIFEVFPAKGRKDSYLAMAAGVRALAERSDGFITLERFKRPPPGKLLSASLWRGAASATRPA